MAKADQTMRPSKKFAINLIEHSPIDVRQRVGLLLVYLGEIPTFSTDLNTISRVTTFKKMLDEIGLNYRQDKEETKGVNKGQVQIHIAKNNAHLLALKKAIRNKDHKTWGRLSGFPKTAIQAYLKFIKVYPKRGEPDPSDEFYVKNGVINDLPSGESRKIRHLYLTFFPSLKYWKSELKVVQKWADAVKKASPKIYKELVWDQKRIAVGEITDKLGKKVDRGIKKTVIVLQCTGFMTSASCEGHIDWGIAGPWVDVEAPGTKVLWKRWAAARNKFEKKWGEYFIPIDKLSKSTRAIYRAIETHKRTEQKRIEKLLKEFYANRPTQKDTKLIVDPGLIRIWSKGAEKNTKVKNKKKKSLKLKEYRAEMNEFTNFLKEKYFDSASPTYKDNPE